MAPMEGVLGPGTVEDHDNVAVAMNVTCMTGCPVADTTAAAALEGAWPDNVPEITPVVAAALAATSQTEAAIITGAVEPAWVNDPFLSS